MCAYSDSGRELQRAVYAPRNEYGFILFVVLANKTTDAFTTEFD